jgi:large subunit ribosomal protein L10
MDKAQKTELVKELAEQLKDADAIYAVDYRGISVPQAAELRSGLREADARFRVVKNRLTLRAADEAGTDALKEHLEGPTALAFVKGDAALAAKTLFRLGEEWELLTYKGGLMDGEALDQDSFRAIARLPGRDQLNAQFAGIVASPVTGLVRGLGSMIQGLALQLGQIAEQGLVTGEAPAEEEAPKGDDETPKEVEAPAGDGDESGSGDEDAVAEDASSDGEAAEPSADESDADPDPEQSPEETTEEEAPEGEDAGQDDPAETGEGDQDIAEEPATESETSEDSDEQKEEGS